jgi:FkbM family methyltransferase
MKLSAFKPRKLQWLFGHDGARKHPFRTVSRLISWELIRILNRTVESRYDEAFDITLVPHEGASRLAYYFGVSEPELFAFYDVFLKPGMTVVDAGANIGLHTLFFAKRVGPEGRVYAFEPGQSAFDRLQSHVKRNQLTNVRCFNCALGAAEGIVSLTENSQDNSRNFVVDDFPGKTGTKNVALRSLNQVLEEESVGRVDFLKIDVEGFEPQVLEGASSYLKRQCIRVLQLELDDSSLARSRHTADQVADMLHAAGFRRAEWSYESGGFRPADRASFNTFFVAENELVQRR